MTARVRRSTPCPHHPDVRDCGDCVAAAHRRAIAAAEVRVRAAPDQFAEVIASMSLGDAEAALAGFNVLRENGIAPTCSPVCPGCNRVFTLAGEVRSGILCPWPRCPGRRVRCELPGVRR